jgi:hypothetical protein
VDCLFSDNAASDRGGGVAATDGNASALTGCQFRDNVGSQGGAVSAEGGSNLLLDHCTLDGNVADTFGGALYSLESSPVLRHCTLAENDAYWGGGIACRFGSHPEITNCIIAFSLSGGSIYCDMPPYLPELSCTDIYGNVGGDWAGYIADQAGQANNLSADPLFCREENPDTPYGLWEESPCRPGANPECGQIGACGVACGVMGAPEVDVEGEGIQSPRISAWPNPLIGHGGTSIEATVAQRDQQVRVQILDAAGALVRSWSPDTRSGAGVRLIWDGANIRGVPVASGMYFLRLKTSCAGSVRTILVVR